MFLKNSRRSSKLANEAIENGADEGDMVINVGKLKSDDWQSGLEFMSSGQMNVNPLITHRVRLEDCKEVFEMMYNRSEVFTKVLFKPEM